MMQEQKRQSELNRFKASFTGIFNSEFEDYLEDKQSTDDKLNLVVSLISLARGGEVKPNFDFNYNFPITKQCLEHPKKTLPLSQINLSIEEKTELSREYRKHIEFYAAKLLTTDKELDEKYKKLHDEKLTDAMPEAKQAQSQTRIITVTVNDIYSNWWDELSKEHKTSLEKHYADLAKKEKDFINELIPQEFTHQSIRKIASYYHLYFDCLQNVSRNKVVDLGALIEGKPPIQTKSLQPRKSYYSDRYYQHMTIREELRDIRYQQSMMRLEQNLWYWQIFSLVSTNTQPIKTNRPDSRQDTSSNTGAVIALLVLGITAASAALYSGKKIYNSIRNIYNNKKVLRSYTRIGCIFGSAVFNSVLFWGLNIPGLVIAATGLLPAAAVGVSLFLSSLIGAGLGAMFAKYSAKFISSIKHGDEINPTNPEKYKLSYQQEEFLSSLGVNLDIFNILMQDIRDTKKEKFWFWSSWPWTGSHHEKHRYNLVIEELKTGKILGKIVFNNREYDLFEGLETTNSIRQFLSLSTTPSLFVDQPNLGVNAPIAHAYRGQTGVLGAPSEKADIYYSNYRGAFRRDCK